MQKVNKRIIILAIIFLLILVVVALLIANFTLSYLEPDIDDGVSTRGETTASGDTLIFSDGNALSLHATTDNFNSSGTNLTDTTNPSVKLISSSKTNEASATYYAGVKILTNDFTYSPEGNAEVILTVYDENNNIVTTSDDGNLTYVTVTDKNGNQISGFDITSVKGAFNIAIEHQISTNSSTDGTTHNWTFTITFVNYTYDQSINETATLDMEVILQKDEIELSFSESIIVLYTEDGVNGLYYHDADLENGAGDNSYRYAGASEAVNNYVCFGYDSIDDCSGSNNTDYLYRIIGVFDRQVKLIKADYATTSLLGINGDYSNTYEGANWINDYQGDLYLSNIGVYYWNNTNYSATGDANNGSYNIWSYSALNTVNLNKNFLENIGETWSSLIADHDWQVGGMNAYVIYSNAQTAYNYEVGDNSSNTTYSAKIELMYVSDYYYAATPTYWTYPGYSMHGSSNDYRAATDYNWMYMGLYEWTISRGSNYTGYAFAVDYTGYMSSGTVNTRALAVRPVFYLESSVVLVSGEGTKTNPYIIA